jgi:hypothetical protein
MSIDWYVFEESYLLNMDYKICENIIFIDLDAKKSNQHPKVCEIKSYEDTFEEIKIVFRGVQYYRGINSTNIMNDPNDDIGNVEWLYIGGSNTLEDGIKIEYGEKRIEIIMNNNSKLISEISSQTVDIKFIEFVSEKITFRAGFDDFEISTISG